MPAAAEMLCDHGDIRIIAAAHRNAVAAVRLLLHGDADLYAAHLHRQIRHAVGILLGHLQGTEQMPDDAQEMGNVYYDAATGKYYYRINE